MLVPTEEGIGSFGARVIGSYIATIEHGFWGTELESSGRAASAIEPSLSFFFFNCSARSHSSTCF